MKIIIISLTILILVLTMKIKIMLSYQGKSFALNVRYFWVKFKIPLDKLLLVEEKKMKERKTNFSLIKAFQIDELTVHLSPITFMNNPTLYFFVFYFYQYTKEFLIRNDILINNHQYITNHENTDFIFILSTSLYKLIIVNLKSKIERNSLYGRQQN